MQSSSLQVDESHRNPGIEPVRLILGDWWKDEDLPLDWDRLMPGGPLCVEVGFGGGEFLLSMAERFRDRRFVGIERFAEGHRRLLKAAQQNGSSNVISMVGDAYIILNLAFADASLHTLTVNFSDPWPKARHSKKRLLTAEFFAIAARKLSPGGRLFAATDDPAYARQAAGAFADTSNLQSLHPEHPWLSDSPHPTTTRYESKWKQEGRPLHYFTFERRAD
jgi:tRNA (guanine-N7-)-methyltransferase